MSILTPPQHAFYHVHDDTPGSEELLMQHAAATGASFLHLRTIVRRWKPGAPAARGSLPRIRIVADPHHCDVTASGTVRVTLDGVLHEGLPDCDIPAYLALCREHGVAPILCDDPHHDPRQLALGLGGA